MAKVGRNERCPCGSDKKYKKCCEASDQRAKSIRLAEMRNAEVESFENDDEPGDALDERTEQVIELIEDGQLEDAEQIARELEIAYPEEHVGTESLALVYEARGLPKVASDHYRRAVSAMDALGRGKYCDCCRERMASAVRRLDPDGPSPLSARHVHA